MTFKTQSDAFLKQIQTRRRNPVKPSTLSSYKSRLNRILVVLGETELSQIENGVMKTFVAGLVKDGLSASAINSLVSLVKEVIASAVDDNGNELFPRKWNSEFIDLPIINHREQKAPISTNNDVQKALAVTSGQERALYALLAGSGLRVGEALALRYGPDNGKDSYWSPETGTVIVRTTMNIKNGQIMSTPKTEAGIREVDLHPELNNFLCSHLANDSTPAQALVFHNQSGKPVRFNTLRENAIEAGILSQFHALRRFRITHLESVGVPPGLQRFWTGHAAGDVHEQYIKMADRIQDRKHWAEKAGLGFQLESNGVRT